MDFDVRDFLPGYDTEAIAFVEDDGVLGMMP
jgi:hypothetical protein